MKKLRTVLCALVLVAAAGWLAMLYGNSLIDDYLRLSGLRH